ncbi:MAG: TIGR02147 family protein, partial [Chitinispirillaceae bacterium]|nr:TIGR02147 family protein [Chitinispirillaceae bacterium]
MVNIFEYQNYRDYLRAYYNEQKALKKAFSYRSFSKKAGIQSPSFLFYVIEGKRNLTKNSVMKISAAIGHNREEAEYFENLVFFNQANNIRDKTYYYSRIVEIRKPFDMETIPLDRYEYY